MSARAEDFQPDSNNPAEAARKSTSSDRPATARVAANRRNAQRSTGPRTEKGKAASAKNAINHGVFVVEAEPITSGPFAEEPNEFVFKIDAIVASLAPRDAIETAVAVRIATLMNSFDRLERWSTALMKGAARMSADDYAAGVGSEGQREESERFSRQLFGYLQGLVADDTADFHMLAVLVRYHGPDPRVGVKNLWDDSTTPQNDEEWKKAFKSLLAHHWADDTTKATVWAYQLQRTLRRELDAVTGLEEQIVANRIMNRPLDLQLKYFARIRRELSEMQKQYSELQQRELPLPEKTNPTDPKRS